MISRAGWIAAASALLIGCASLSTQADLADAKQHLEQFTAAVEVVDLDLLDPSGMTEKAAEDRILSLHPDAERQCVAPYRSKLLTAFTSGYDMSPDSVMRLAAISATMDGELLACLKPMGLAGYYGLEVGKEVMRMSRYIVEADRAVKYYRHTLLQAHLEAEANKIAFAYGMMGAGQALQSRASPNPLANPSQVYVAPYARKDGTIVRGHRRTVADALCFNNLQLRGCD